MFNKLIKKSVFVSKYSILIGLLISLTSAQAFSYTVKKGDTLANIVRKNYTGPVFGKNGGVAKLLEINPHIKNFDLIEPGMTLTLNKELLKPGIIDNVEQKSSATEQNPEAAEPTTEDVLEKEVSYKGKNIPDSQNEISPYIEVEKYDAANDKLFKGKVDDKLSFFVNFQYNNFAGKNLNTLDIYNFNTSSETDIGIEYTKYHSPSTNFFGSFSFNQFSLPEVTTFIPTLDSSSKSQLTATFGGRYLFTEGNFVTYALNYQPHYYLTVNTANHLVLEHTASPSVSLDTENQVYNNDDFTLGLNFGFDYITNSVISGNGLGFNLGFIYQQDFKSNDKLRVKFLYKQTNLDSSTHNLTDNSLSLNFLYSLPY